ncbi:MAG: deoxyribodipyrimidine photo-lyase [Isosphaeraceae bacterium]|nr:deoxyribodipyrimidine photo-lyase [Isosphaeraceae bacterium]
MSIPPDDPRVRSLVDGRPDPEGRCVLLWVQRAQRGRDNPALDRAIAWGKALDLPVLAVFGLTAHYPSAHRRHYRFMVEGLVQTRSDLLERRVPLVVRLGSPDEVVAAVAAEVRPAIVIGDENPVRIGRLWRERVAASSRVPVELVDADVVVPSALFPKEEFAARTIRPKIHRVLAQFLVPSPNETASRPFPVEEIPAGEPIEVESLMERLAVGGIGEVRDYPGGPHEADRRLARFIDERLPVYATERNEPTPYMTSELSAHLHFGQISPIAIALSVLGSDAPEESKAAYVEELIVRREVAVNFVWRNPNYDKLAGCPNWALLTLAKHAGDPRPHLYDAQRLEAGETHDPLWNAAQWEMVVTGRMHNYLRMYWAKKILEWSPDAETAFDVALDLNDRYEMDGRDPNGYTGVAWAIGGKHDRPWGERAIFGTVRFMSYESTRKKFDSASYIRRAERLRRGDWFAS